MRNAIATVGVLAMLAGAAAGQASRDLVRTDDSGAVQIRGFGPLASAGESGPSLRQGLLWTFPDAVSITESVSLGDGGTDSWVAHVLNDERVSKFTTTGAGTPDFVVPMQAEEPATIGVSCAADVSLCGIISTPAGSPVRVGAYSESNGSTALWTYDFAAQYTNASKRNIDVNDDGSVFAALAYNGADSLLVILDGSGDVLGSVQVAGFCSGVELSGDGSRVVVTAGEYARLFDTATLTEQFALRTSGSGGYHRISRDGTAICAGGFNIRAAREVGGVWQQVYAGSGTSDWFGWGMALSGDGTTLFAVSHDYAQNYLANDHRIVDLLTGNEIANDGFVGSGSFQNSIVGAQVDQTGQVFACASWGEEPDTHPEVRIYDRALNLIGSIDTDGSPYDIDLTPTGRFVLVGSKAVHANTFGNGGRTYAYELESDCYADFNGDGVVDTRDVLAYLNAWNAQDPNSDCDENGVVDTRDVLCFLNLWNAGC